MGGCACFALGVPDAVQIGQTNNHPQKRHIPRQAGRAQAVNSWYEIGSCYLFMLAWEVALIVIFLK
jgi:hypothetical protein